MKASAPSNQFTFWRSEQLFNIDFASYSLAHHGFSRHFHDHYVIELVIKGADEFYCNGKTYTAEKNQLVLINPGEVHTGSTVLDTPLQYFSLYPDKKTLEEVAEAVGINLSSDFNFQRSLLNHSVLTEKFHLLYQSFILKADPASQQEIFLDCMQTLLKLPASNRSRVTLENKKDRRVEFLIDFIRTHFKEDVSLQQMADMVRLNPFHLVRLFKKVIGVSPYDYLINTRAEHSRQLLRKGYKVQEAAQQAGFYDSSHLNRSIRKIAGTSPKSFLSSKSQFRTSFIA